MSRETLLEMDEFYRSTGAGSGMIPERDGDVQKPRPKPRPRSAIKPAKSGTVNSAYEEDENENESKNPWGWTGTNRTTDTFVDISSSDESARNNGSRKTPISVVSAVEVHSFDDRSEDSANSAQIDSESSLHYENERKPRPPKPKPRRKHATQSTTTSENDTDNYKDNSENKPTPSKPVKEDFLTIAIPENEDGIQILENKPNKSEEPPAAGFRQMMRKARNFLSSSKTSRSVESIKPITKSVIETPKLPSTSPSASELHSPKLELPIKSSPRAGGSEDFELKTVQKRKSLRQRDEEVKSRDSTALAAEYGGSSLQSTPSSTKREKRRRESGSTLTKLVGITIHSCDPLPADPNVRHPVVRVTVMDQNGLFLNRRRPSESANITSGQGSIEKPKSSRRRSRSASVNQDESDLDADNKKQKSGSGRSRKSHQAGKSDTMSVKLNRDSLQPIMTQYFKMDQHMTGFNAPNWNELLVFEEPYDPFVSFDSTSIFFFEIMDFLPMNTKTKKYGWRKYHGGECNWYKIAWAFLKPVGANGVRNVNRKLRLQLYKPEALSKAELDNRPEIYCWWKLQKRQKLNATLYVTLKGVLPPTGAVASLRTLLTMRKEHLTEAILDSQLATRKERETKATTPDEHELTRKEGKVDITQQQWTRLEGQRCKVPNKLLMSLPTSKIGSLNLTVCGSCHVVKFSPCGLKLAAGFHTDEIHSILVFEIPSGAVLQILRYHHDLIYDIDWSPLPLHTEKNTKTSSEPNYLASASADSTALVWNAKQWGLMAILPHPAFVYCVRFHPLQTDLIVTGCFDYIIRIWDISRGKSAVSNEGSPTHGARPIIMLDRHFSFVNSIAFQSNGEFLFSGDGSGNLYKWKVNKSANKWKLVRNKQMSLNGGYPINSITMHPNGSRILIQIRESCLQLVDVESFLVLHSFTGMINSKFQVRSCMSPCGNLVLSGSEDASICIWNADTSLKQRFIHPEYHPKCIVTSVDYHPFDNYLAVGLSSFIGEPNPIMIYGFVLPGYKPDELQLGPGTFPKLKSSIHSSESDPELKDLRVPKRNVTFAPKRGESTEKFRKIIRKLDSALKIGKHVNEPNDSRNLPKDALNKMQMIELKREIVAKENEILSPANRKLSASESEESVKTKAKTEIKELPKEMESWSSSPATESPAPKPELDRHSGTFPPIANLAQSVDPTQLESTFSTNQNSVTSRVPQKPLRRSSNAETELPILPESSKSGSQSRSQTEIPLPTNSPHKIVTPVSASVLEIPSAKSPINMLPADVRKRTSFQTFHPSSAPANVQSEDNILNYLNPRNELVSTPESDAGLGGVAAAASLSKREKRRRQIQGKLASDQQLV